MNRLTKLGLILLSLGVIISFLVPFDYIGDRIGIGGYFGLVAGLWLSGIIFLVIAAVRFVDSKNK